MTLQYFGDLECPICKEFTLGALPHDHPEVGAHGQAADRIPLAGDGHARTGSRSRTQQVAALAAGKQNKMWHYIELFYHEQGEENSGYVTESYLQGLAQQVPGLNLAQWTSDRSNPALTNQVADDAQAANNAASTARRRS